MLESKSFHKTKFTRMDYILLCVFIQIASFFIIYYSKKSKFNIYKSHKLAKAPEPPGAWPVIGHLHLLRGHTPAFRILGALADKYGSIFSLRLGNHHSIVVSNWQEIKECFTTNDKAFANRPNLAFTKYVAYDGAGFALAPYGTYWREVRKMVTVELFTARRLASMSHIRASEVDLFIKDLHSLSTSSGDVSNKVVVPMCSWFEYVTINVTLRMVVGKRFSIWKKGVDRDWEFIEALKRALHLSGVFVWSDVIPSLEWLDIGGYIKGMKQSFKDLDQVLEEWFQERIQTDSSTDDASDFLDVMMSAIPSNQSLSGYDKKTVIKATMLILTLTGSESMAVTLTWALSLLLNNPRALEKVQNELDLIIGRDRWVQEPDINNLHYLRSVFKETLRLYPAAPLAGPHEATQDCHVGKYYVPKGTRLIVNLWKMHRDPNVWADPEEFRPERFLEERSGVNFGGQCHEYTPFGSGRRMCPGMMFGLQVVELTLARLLQGFHVSTLDEPVDMAEGVGIALSKVNLLQVLLSPRLSPKLYQQLSS